jgi:hypothetical protein
MGRIIIRTPTYFALGAAALLLLTYRSSPDSEPTQHKGPAKAGPLKHVLAKRADGALTR